MKYVSSLIISAIILNIGKFFELQPTQCIERPGFSGVFRLGPIHKNYVYAFYNMVILRILITGIIPVTLLICLYTKIFFKIREHKLNMASQNITVKSKMVKEQTLAITFAGVVIASIICTIPGWLVVIKVLIDGGEAENLNYYETVFIVRDILFTVNSSINIFIYTCLDTTFRRELRKFLPSILINPLKCRKNSHPHPPNSENEIVTSNSNIEMREIDKC